MLGAAPEHEAISKAGELLFIPPGVPRDAVNLSDTRAARANFILKDGPSGGWTSKANKENKYRRYRQDVMTRRERDHVFKTRLIPNYQGQEAPSWREAQEEARSRDGDLAASTYEPHVSKESAAQ